MFTLHQREVLSDALDAFSRAQVQTRLNPSFENVSAEIRATNRLYALCADAGMPLGEADIGEWAAVRLYAPHNVTRDAMNDIMGAF